MKLNEFKSEISNALYIQPHSTKPRYFRAANKNLGDSLIKCYK